MSTIFGRFFKIDLTLSVLRLPEWTKTVFYPGSELEAMNDDFFKSYTQTQEMTRLKYGFLLQEIMNRFYAKIQSTLEPDRNIRFYSAHDHTIASLLNIFGLYVSYFNSVPIDTFQSFQIL